MRIVITGASGNVGTALLRRLVEEGQHEIVGVVRRPPASGEPYDDVEWSTVDLTRDDGHAGRRVPRRRRDRAPGVVVPAVAPGALPPSSVSAGPDASSRRPPRRRCRTSCTCPPSAPTRPSATTSPSTRRGRPCGSRPPCTAGTRPPPNGCSTVSSASAPDVVVTRIRPDCGPASPAAHSCATDCPRCVPSALLSHVPVVPLDRRLAIPMVHADDVGRRHRAGDPGAGARGLQPRPRHPRSRRAYRRDAGGAARPCSVRRGPRRRVGQLALCACSR